MKILVTGGMGQLGWDCREVFAQHEVLSLDLPNLDITDSDSVDGILNLWKPDVLVNCAAYTAVDRAESDVAKSWHVNRDGPALLASRAKAHGIFLVHISTDYVFDGVRPVPQPYVETDANNLFVDPKGPVKGDKCVLRGGDYLGLEPDWSRPSYRWKTDPDTYNHAIGFRCAASVAPAKAP